MLAAGAYIDVMLAVIAFIQLPPPKLPWFFYPTPAPIIIERNPYENDCWTDEQCGYWEYDI